MPRRILFNFRKFNVSIKFSFTTDSFVTVTAISVKEATSVKTKTKNLKYVQKVLMLVKDQLNALSAQKKCIVQREVLDHSYAHVKIQIVDSQKYHLSQLIQIRDNFSHAQVAITMMEAHA